MSVKQLFKYGTGIVVPCYNEEERLQLSEFSRFFKTDNTTYFCFVDDGSTDDTKKIVADFVDNNVERCQVINLFYNQGKAEAVRHGITK
jgi:glycosyltransferase involved in cell wall biosynthesis